LGKERAMEKNHEYEIRCKAIKLYEKGTGFNQILPIFQRSRFWLSKWLRRYRAGGLKGLRDKSRAPQRVWRKTSERLVQKILSIRKELELHRGRRLAFAGIGPEVIRWELQQRKFCKIPAVSTIAAILSRHGKAGKRRVQRRNGGRPYPYFPAEEMGDLQQTDIVGPRYLRGPQGVTRFYSFHTVDAGGHTAFSSQFPDKQTISLCCHLVESWRWMGIPKVSQIDNEMAATGGGRYPYSLSQLIRLHLLLGIHLVFIPQGEPGRNATVESFNGLWQERVLHRHLCPSLRALRRTSDRFLRYYHYEKPHRGLTRKDQDTRFPGILRDRLWKSLVHLPHGFRLDRYINTQSHLHFPVAQGKVSFIRKVDTKGYIEVNGSAYFIRKKLEGQYVVASIYPHRKRLVVKQDNRIVKWFAFPVSGKIIDPFMPHKKKKN
jgi:putative transposase